MPLLTQSPQSSHRGSLSSDSISVNLCENSPSLCLTPDAKIRKNRSRHEENRAGGADRTVQHAAAGGLLHSPIEGDSGGEGSGRCCSGTTECCAPRYIARRVSRNTRHL